MRALRVGTADVLEVEPTCSDELAETPGCSSSELCLGGAAGVVDLGGVEAHEPDVGVLVINLDRVGIENPNVGRIDWLGEGWHCQKQRSDTG